MIRGPNRRAQLRGGGGENFRAPFLSGDTAGRVETILAGSVYPAESKTSLAIRIHGKRFVVRADEKLSMFVELERQC
jgi:hypothetical protein